MYVIAGLISTIAIVLFELLLLQIPFSLHDFRPWLVFPAGGLMEGALCASGLYLYLKFKCIHLKPKHFVFAILISLIGFWAINYIGYFSAYVDGNTINHSFKGMHISNYYFSFFDYLNYMFSNYTVKTYSSGGMILSQDNLGTGFHVVTFILEGIGFCLGGIGSCVFAIQGREYCKRCKIEFMSKKLYSFNPDKFDLEINELKCSFDSKETFKEQIQRKRIIESENKPFITVFLKYCMSCKKSYIEFRYMYPKLGRSNEVTWKENRDQLVQIEAPYQVTSKA